MKFFIIAALFVTQSFAKTDLGSQTNDEKKTEKRGVVDLHGSTAYATAAPALATVSHGPAILSAVTATPGIVYAPEKQIVATASPSQVYAKPSPHITKISDAVLAGHQQTYTGLLTQQLYQAPQAYQQLAKVGYSSPTYAVSAPIPSHLAYSKHQIYQPQVYTHQPQVYTHQPQVYSHQPQVLSHYTQPQALYSQSHLNYVHPQVSHYTQPQVLHAQPQVQYVQPQVNYHQPQIYHTQALQHQIAYPQTIAHAAVAPAAIAQPVAKVAYTQQAAYTQPAAYTQQVYAAQPAISKDGAVSFASFSQGHNAALQYAAPAAKVSYATPVVAAQPTTVVAKPIVAPVYQTPQYYQHPQQVYSAHDYNQAALYAAQSKVAYAQPQVTYATQYFGKIAQGNPIAYAGYNH